MKYSQSLALSWRHAALRATLPTHHSGPIESLEDHDKLIACMSIKKDEYTFMFILKTGVSRAHVFCDRRLLHFVVREAHNIPWVTEGHIYC